MDWAGSLAPRVAENWGWHETTLLADNPGYITWTCRYGNVEDKTVAIRLTDPLSANLMARWSAPLHQLTSATNGACGLVDRGRQDHKYTQWLFADEYLASGATQPVSARFGPTRPVSVQLGPAQHVAATTSSHCRESPLSSTEDVIMPTYRSCSRSTRYDQYRPIRLNYSHEEKTSIYRIHTVNSWSSKKK